MGQRGGLRRYKMIKEVLRERKQEEQGEVRLEV